MITDGTVADEHPTTTSHKQPPHAPDAAPLSPTTTDVQANERLVNAWLNKRYLAHDLEDGGEAVISVGEFLDIVQTELPECLMPEQTVTLALELCVRDHGCSNTLVISDVHAQKLYALGVERETRADVLSELSKLQQILLDAKNRWIIIPCNDGVIDTEQIGKRFAQRANTSETTSVQASVASASATLNTAETTIESTFEPRNGVDTVEKGPEVTQEKSKGPIHYGTHWGLLVIDETNRIARWVDSLTRMAKVEIPDQPPKWRFIDMHRTAKAAGKTLRGLETLLGEDNGFTQGGFTTSTLKWNPNQGDDNSCRGDEGACGPFVFAFLEHILDRASTLNSVGVRRMFPRERKGRVLFDSIGARQKIRTLIQGEIEKRTPLRPGDLPLGLTADVLRSLMILMPVDQVMGQIQQLVDMYRDRRLIGTIRHSRGRSAHGGSTPGIFSDPIFLQAFLEDRRDNPDKYEGLSDDEAMQIFFAEQQSMASRGGDNPQPISTEFFLGKELYRNVPLDDEAIWPARERDINYPKTFSKLPNFAKLTQQSLQRWLKGYPEIKKKINTEDREQVPTACALLHHRIYRTFLGQSDDDFEKMWSKDKAVFDPEDGEFKKIKAEENAKIKYGMMRLKMMQHYQGTEAVNALLKILEKYKVKASAKRKESKDGKDDKDSKCSNNSYSDNDDKPNGTDGSGGTSGTEPAGSSSGAGDLFSHGYQSGSASSSTRIALQDSATFRIIASQAIDFASMEDHHVVEWVHKTAGQEFLTEKINIWETRARLQQAFGDFNTTSKETAALYRGHLGLDGSLGFEQIIDTLRQHTDNVPDLRGQIRWYPDYYLREHGAISTETERRGADKQGAPASGGSGAAGHAGTDKRSDDHNSTSDKDASGARSSLLTPGLEGLFDFRTMTGPEIAGYMTPKLRGDPRLAPIRHNDELLSPGLISYRALLFVERAGGRFENESDADILDLWAKDPLVFTEQQRKMGYEASIIRNMMERLYYRRGEDDEDFFVEESDTELEDDEVEGVDADDDILAPPAAPATAPADHSTSAGTKRKRTSDGTAPVKKRSVGFAP